MRIGGVGDLGTLDGLSLFGSKCKVADPVDVATGAFQESYCLLTAPNRGADLKFGLDYNSAKTNSDSSVGYGWSTGVEASLSLDRSMSRHGVVVRQEDGTEIRMLSDDGVTYVPPAEAMITLERNTKTGVYTLTRHRQQKLQFDSGGRLISRKDLNGEGLTYAYDASNRLSTVQGTSGHSLAIQYDGASRLIDSVVGPMGRTVELNYDGSGNLVSFTNSTGGQTSFEYSGRLITDIHDSTGHVAHNVYDAARRVTSQTNALAQPTTFTYGTNTTTVETPASSGTATTKYTFANRQVSEIKRALGTAVESTVGYERDPATMQITKRTNPDASFATATYDAQGNLLTSTDELGRTTTHTYDSLNNRLSTISPAGVESRWTYDESGNLLTAKVENPGGGWRTTTYTYGDPEHPGDATAVTSPRGGQTSFEYNDAGLVTRTVSPAGESSATYNDMGQPLTEVAIGGHAPGANQAQFTTTYSYLPDGRYAGSTNGHGKSTELTYGAGSRVATETGPDGETVSHSYDALGRRTGTAYENGESESLAYDPAGNITNYTDAAGHVRQMIYDKLNRKTLEVDDEGRSQTFTYDGSDRLTTLTRNDSSVVTYGYDAAGQLTSVDYPGTSSDATFAYNLDGVMTSMVDATGTTAMQVDAAGRVDQVTSPVGVLSYGFDEHGDQVSVTYPSGRQVQRTFDTAGRMTDLSDGFSRDFGFGYGADGGLSTVALPNAVVSQITRDSLGQVTGIEHANTSGSLLAAQYAYTDAGLNSSVVETGASASSQQFGYDRRDRLTASGDSGGTNWDVDVAGNVVAARGNEQVFDDGDRLLSANTPGGVIEYSYDDRGNRVQSDGPGGVLTYGFDAADRMVTDALGTSFGFTADGLRAWAQPSGGPASTWVWDRSGSLPLLLSDGLREFVYGPGGMLLEDDPVSGDPVFTLSDRFGSVRAGTDTAGDVVWSRAFDAYGATITSDTAPGFTGTPSPVGFHGLYTDTSGLLYARARVLDPATSTFLSVDPLVSETGEAYSYASANPITFTDPTGQASHAFTTDSGTGQRSVEDAGCAWWQQLTDPANAADLATTYGGAIAGGLTIVGVAGYAGFKAWKAGREIKIGNNWRIAPFGNRTGHPTGRWPHYHRRGVDKVTGETASGQGVGRHRPWDSKDDDASFWDRF